VVLRVKKLGREGERVCLQWQISDTGKGIAPADQAFIFEPFYQSEGNSHVIAGTGLGLPICLRLTHLMNGTLRMVSEPGLGSSFSLTVPLEQPSGNAPQSLQALAPEIVYVLSPIRELADSLCGWLRRWGARAQVGLPTSTQLAGHCVLLELMERRLDLPWQGPRVLASNDGAHEPQFNGDGWQVNLNDLDAIQQAVRHAQNGQVVPPQTRCEARDLRPLHLHILVAEDNVINQLILRDQLEELGCSVELAGDGEDALARWHEGTFDVVLTDVNMPRLNGYELAEALRRLGCTTPIIGATANALRGEEALCLAAGMNHCLVKPFTLRALSTVLAPYERATHEAL
jgi:two-component system capsular synthesis sensor histidine kinase RcsC